MPFMFGQYDDLDGEPSRGMARHVLLTALRLTPAPLHGRKILDDLYRRCIVAPAIHGEGREDDFRRAHRGAGALADAPPGVRERVVEWGTAYRLTDPNGHRNEWLLDTAVNSLIEWREAYPPDPASPSATTTPKDLHLSMPSRLRSYKQPFTDAERTVWDPLFETREGAEARLRAAGASRDAARSAIAGVLDSARERWHQEDREAARKVRVTAPPPRTAEERAAIMAELRRQKAETPLPDVELRDRIRRAPEWRRRSHGRPAVGSELGPLARDFAWLAAVVCTPERPLRQYAPGETQQNVTQRVKNAAQQSEFVLPEPLFTDRAPRRTSPLHSRPRA